MTPPGSPADLVAEARKEAERWRGAIDEAMAEGDVVAFRPTLKRWANTAALLDRLADALSDAAARGRREALEERERFEQRTAILRAELEAWRRLCDRLVKTLADERAMQPPAPIIFDVSGTGEERSPR